MVNPIVRLDGIWTSVGDKLLACCKEFLGWIKGVFNRHRDLH